MDIEKIVLGLVVVLVRFGLVAGGWWLFEIDEFLGKDTPLTVIAFVSFFLPFTKTTFEYS